MDQQIPSWWAEAVLANFSDQFYSSNSRWIESSDGKIREWLTKLNNKTVKPERAAVIIERAFNLFNQFREATENPNPNGIRKGDSVTHSSNKKELSVEGVSNCFALCLWRDEWGRKVFRAYKLKDLTKP